MTVLYTATEIGRMLNLSSQTIKDWEAAGYVPLSYRFGLRKTRKWSAWKVQRILQFAKDNGYIIDDAPIPPELKEGLS